MTVLTWRIATIKRGRCGVHQSRVNVLSGSSLRLSVFRSLKSELGIRPIYHQLENRADAHVLIAFLAYCLQVTLKNRLMIHAPGLTPTAVFEKLATIQMVEVWIPMLDGRWLIMPRHTQPDKDVQAVLDHLQINMPSQPPPRIRASQSVSVPAPAQPSLW